MFKLNWIEYFIMKRIFSKSKYKILKDVELKGKKVNLVILDEVKNEA